MAYLNINLTHDVDNLAIDTDAGTLDKNLGRVRNYLRACQSGAQAASSITIEQSAVAATGTITFGGVPDADDTVIIAGVTFTAKSSASGEVQWARGADATASAANLAAKINAVTSTTAGIYKCITASADTGVLTITSAVPGFIGNAISTRVGTNVGAALTADQTHLAGGTSTRATYSFGNR